MQSLGVVDEFDEIYEKAMDITPNVTFVDTELAESFDCAICYEKYRNAVAVCDDHIYCQACINELIANSGPIFNCPTCRRKCTQFEIKRVKFIDRQIQNLLIKCPNHQITPIKAIYLKKLAKKNNKNKNKNKKLQRSRARSRSQSPSSSLGRSRSRSRSRERGDDENNESNTNNTNNSEKEGLKFCDWTGKLEKLGKHILECAYEVIRCGECNECVERGKTEFHNLFECEMYPIECELCDILVPRTFMQYHKNKKCKMAMSKCGSCNEEIRRINIKKHYNQCPNAIVDCNYYRYGCNVMSIKRKDLKKHLDENIKKHLTLVCQSHASLENKVKELNETTQKRFQHLEQIIYSGALQWI